MHNPRTFAPLDKKSVELENRDQAESVNAICLYACSVTGFYDFHRKALAM
jgi:hypothetical protein